MADARVASLAFGGAPAGNLYTGVEHDAACEAIAHAWRSGITHFDTAPYYGYGLSESRLGEALAGIERSGYTLSTKVGRLIDVDESRHDRSDGFAVDGRRAYFDYSRDGVLRSLESSIKRLRTGRIDLLLLHDIGELTHGERHAQVLAQALDEALPAMAALRDQGVVGAIGLGVNEEAVCLEVMQRFPLDAVMLAGRYTLFEQARSETVMARAQADGVSVLVAAPYNSGLLGSDTGPGDTYDYAPASAVIRERAQRFYEVCGRTHAQVGAAALQFPLAHPAVAKVVCGLRSTAEVDSAIARMRAPIPSATWTALVAEGLLDPRVPTP
ncbi:aldo/keto reductase [Dyella telluris]|uniref:Aldo/keto reductase n=2 Tax=Dyella telluris TaxID=2763498 RepID=A0A7G8QAX0_9GAMM|nr:aldo/keto reductase [Dyella telluris]